MNGKINAEALIGGDEPYQIWLRTGQAVVILAVISYLSIDVAGIETGKTARHVPLVASALGFAAMWYGTRQKQLERRRRERLKREPSRGLDVFLNWFATLDLPITRVELARERNPYDTKKTEEEMQAAINTIRCGWWVLRGDIVEYGDTYDLRKK